MTAYKAFLDFLTLSHLEYWIKDNDEVKTFIIGRPSPEQDLRGFVHVEGNERSQGYSGFYAEFDFALNGGLVEFAVWE